MDAIKSIDDAYNETVQQVVKILEGKLPQLKEASPISKSILTALIIEMVSKDEAFNADVRDGIRRINEHNIRKIQEVFLTGKPLKALQE